MKLFYDDKKIPFWVEVVGAVTFAFLLATMFVSAI